MADTIAVHKKEKMPLTVTLPTTLCFSLCSERCKNSYTLPQNLTYLMQTNILQSVFHLLMVPALFRLTHQKNSTCVGIIHVLTSSSLFRNAVRIKFCNLIIMQDKAWDCNHQLFGNIFHVLIIFNMNYECIHHTPKSHSL